MRPVSPLVARLRSLLRGLFRRDTVEAEMREEMAHHIELRAADLERDGMEPKEARRRAHLEFGHVEGHREEARASRGLRFFDQIRFSWLDVKLGMRMLWKHPGLTVVAAFALAVGIPVGLAPGHFVRAVSSSAHLPISEGHRVHAIRYWDVQRGVQAPTATADFVAWRDGLTTFESVGAVRGGIYSVTAASGASDALTGAEVTASAFNILRVSPRLGRAFDASDERPGSPPVVVIGHDLWHSQFLGDPSVLDQMLIVNGREHSIIGVMPEGFLFPNRDQLWLPLESPGPGLSLDGPPLLVFGRLASGVDVAAAEAQVLAISGRLAEEDPQRYESRRPQLVSFGMAVLQIQDDDLNTNLEFLLLQLLALALLGLACANVGILTFARSATRLREIAIRTALGAGRARVISQLFAESLTLALLSAGAGLFLGGRLVEWAYERFVQFAEGQQVGAAIPYWFDLGVTPTTVFVALGLAVVSAGIAGVLPALKLTGNSIHWNIQKAQAGRSGVRFGGVTGTLIVLDVAMAVAAVGLAVGFSDMVLRGRASTEAMAIPTEQFLSVALASVLRGDERPDSPGVACDAFVSCWDDAQQRVLDRLRAEPRVRGVAVANVLPRMGHPSRRIEVEDEETGTLRQTFTRATRVAPGYFEGMGLPLRAGRDFGFADLEDGAAAIIVNESFVTSVFAGRNAIGRRLRVAAAGDGEPGPWLEVVGVVADVGALAMFGDESARVGIYEPVSFGEIHPSRLAVWVAGDPEAFIPRLREIVGEADATTVFAENPRSLDSVYPLDLYLGVAATAGWTLFIAVLLSLAASGIYAMLSFAVSERTREIGIRTALGSTRASIVLTVTRRSLGQIGLGALLGMPLAALIFRGLQEGLGATGRMFAVGLFAGTFVIGAIGLFAGVSPTLRALRIEPTEALRVE